MRLSERSQNSDGPVDLVAYKVFNRMDGAVDHNETGEYYEDEDYDDEDDDGAIYFYSDTHNDSLHNDSSQQQRRRVRLML